ncbi:DUF4232 domain-containing protein [Streptomyces sp. NPDC056112]|uniref:DUF4232 domain-containing protein n=1 Tax=unclassified Streptomyces TaxID=2593676 RepID=UPI0024813E7A|nr:MULTISPECIES: DUF4232 domain-containing protein [unclassified Streptomyces]
MGRTAATRRGAAPFRLHLDNCGTRAYSVEVYPLLELLDDDLEPVDGVEILDGSGEITTGAGPDEQPRPVTLAPGESATAGLVWRHTTEFGTPVDVPHVRVRAEEGAASVTVTPHLDLGTTGKLGGGPWEKRNAGPSRRLRHGRFPVGPGAVPSSRTTVV